MKGLRGGGEVVWAPTGGQCAGGDGTERTEGGARASGAHRGMRPVIGWETCCAKVWGFSNNCEE